MKNLINFDAVLSLIDNTIRPIYLNPTQEIVLREVWNGKTYSKIADEYSYDPEYMKTVGCSLWQMLSHAFNEQITKSNFVPFMRQKLMQYSEEKKVSSVNAANGEDNNSHLDKRAVFHWATAPSIKFFVGREEEINQLHQWSQEIDCRCIIVTGMVGCGKTTLVTKFARDAKNNFEFVIWVSLIQTPSLETFLSNYIEIIDPQVGKRLELQFSEPGTLLSMLIDYLKRHKVLLIVDGLQSILRVNRETSAFKKEYEDYGQFLRSIISTHHNSLLIATSHIKPKMLEYYGNQVKFLDLQGLKPSNYKTFFQADDNISLDEQKLLSLSKTLHVNPQLLKIVNNHLEEFSEETIEQTIEEISLLEAIVNLLERDLSYLSDLDLEIIYWLAISNSPVSLETICQNIEQSHSKLNFSSSINCLIKRSLVIRKGSNYTLMPILKSYLRRKMVRKILQK